MTNIKPKDIIACITIIFIFVSKMLGFNGALDPVLALILGYYFVKRKNGLDNGK